MDCEYMTRINRYRQIHKVTVEYDIIDEKGPPHDPEFTIVVKINGKEYGRGTGKSKKEAKAVAAKETWEMIEEQIEAERSNGSFTFSKYSNVSQVPAESDSENSICFEDSSARVVEKMKDMAICEKPSPCQGNAPSSIPKSKRKLAANFANVRSMEEGKKKSDSNESWPDVNTNTGEEYGNPHTVNKTFLHLFEKIEPVGVGGFGNVFKATSKSDKKTYAIKRVVLTEKVEREAEGLARLTHENIVRYHCSWEGDDYIKYPDSSQNSDKKFHCLFIQMEFCEQGTLEKWIEKHREDPNYHAMAQNKFLQIVKGVEYIHSKGLIHRDLKPQNIFISHDDKVKIGDFGLVTSVAFETLTEDRGTKSYMAPEQFGVKYGKEVDIYALGLIWFEILSACTHHEKTKTKCCVVVCDSNLSDLFSDIVNNYWNPPINTKTSSGRKANDDISPSVL
ncbi:hypothetical protein DUI87_10143 [Hirundo rustica rustica]|uniref:Protein kinase domain-containing protein n=1 Tax=Hirundo rustica rustica TaxID=333673 RepID=A0A3M0KHA1_HIRRU|nr:hypothetical protein DUI87_10143 [Hirundo rustica rustica]